MEEIINEANTFLSLPVVTQVAMVVCGMIVVVAIILGIVKIFIDR